MRAYSLWQMPWLSFFSKKLYQESGLRGKGMNGRYLLLLLAVCLIPSVVNFNRGLHTFFSQEAPKLIDQLPEITIAQGEASLTASQPYEIRDPETGQLWILIDTRDGALAENEDFDAGLILTRTQLIYHKNKYETRMFNLANIPSLVLNQGVLWKWLRIFTTSVSYLSYPCALVFVYSIKLLQALIFSLIGLLLCAWLKANPISFGGVFRITILALTPALLLKTVIKLFGVSIPAAGWIYFCLILGYLVFGILAIAQAQKISSVTLPQPAALPVPKSIPAPVALKLPGVKAKVIRKKTVRKVKRVVKKAPAAIRKRAVKRKK